MKTILDVLEERISAAMSTVTGQDQCAAIIRPTADAKFGDYQANGIMALGKRLRTNPRQLAEQVVEQLDLADLCEPVEIAGPGFINLRLKSDYVADQLLRINSDASGRLGIEPETKPQTIVVDFSSPNIAKEMHVGHLRSTIIGDAICRTLEFMGQNVIRQNHIGDWGTQFGRVILGLWHLCMAEKRQQDSGEETPYYQTEAEQLASCAGDEAALKDLCQRIRDRHETDWSDDSSGELTFVPFLARLGGHNVEDLWEKFLRVYQYVNAVEQAVMGMDLSIPTIIDGQQETIAYESLSRRITVMLQGQEEQELNAWRFIRKLTLEHCSGLYEKLGVGLTMDDVCGESFYNDRLPSVVSDLHNLGLAEESDGAMCVFPDGFKNKEGQRLPFIIQKSDGAFLYATTDLAALRYRVDDLKANAMAYVTDARQKLHFEMLFAVAKMAQWVGDDVKLSHVMFGSVLGDNGKPLKTRSGENVKLKNLLDEAVERAKTVVQEKNPDLPEEKKTQIAQAVGIGAVKYADYSNNRTSDYVFSFDKMLAMDGNTAPYMQYAYARIKSIERKAESKGVSVDDERRDIDSLDLAEPAELDLGKHLARYGEAIESAATDYRPNYLTTYLFELAQKFSAFYTNCPVLDAQPAKRPTRLLLCDLTARTIRHGLSELLGIAVVEQM